MSVSAIPQSIATQASTASTSSSVTNGIDINGFYELLATQLKYQDADNPMDTAEMMNMMVQTQMIDAITQLVEVNAQASQINTITYASSMVGKTVTVAEVDANGMYTGEDTTGVVTGMMMGDNPTIYVDGKEYYLAQIMNIGEVPAKEDVESEEDNEDEYVDHWADVDND